MTVIAHVSDLHLTPVPFPFGEGLKPALGWINWARKPGAHDGAIAARIIAALRAARPDHVALTGDLIELGLTTEYAAAGAALGEFGDPERVSWAPGNHDVYTRRAAQRLQAILGDWLGPPAGEGDLRARFPRLTLAGRVAVVTLCSGTPTWLFSAEGELGAAQLGRLDTLLAGLDRRAQLPVLAIHHPPHAPGLSRLKRLREGEALMALLARHGCPLVLHGHLHRACDTVWTGATGTITLAGAPSASAAGRHGDDPAGFSLIHVASDLSWRLERRTLS
ncbi:MAG: metallophosphoesterase [Phreatobacter sp.]|uniref:metallophosphoesterase family protein n=1 Tax=Phreatobacter sp. TaxID=1966341 RepID=UPI0027345C11|nr:metallophosphoesterase [Phreatobacter sp.]MDP2800675.1 metallophosphoesterase [Phreatobacter sp.]